MKKFVAGRLLSVLPVLAVVSVVIFSIVHLAPGDPAASILGDNATAEDIAALRTRMGLDKPLAEQYLIWMGNILHGDFGLSVAGNETVAHMLASHWEPTLSLTIFSTVLALCLAIPLGILAARKKGTAADYGVSVLFSGRNFASQLSSGPVLNDALCREVKGASRVRIRTGFGRFWRPTSAPSCFREQHWDSCIPPC